MAIEDDLAMRLQRLLKLEEIERVAREHYALASIRAATTGDIRMVKVVSCVGEMGLGGVSCGVR